MILYSFRETRRFTQRMKRVFDGDELADLQWSLLAAPEQGAIIPQSGGIRKLRWAASGRGKRGGARVIYYFPGDDEEIYLLDIYTKNDKGDLALSDLRELRAQVKEWLSDEKD